MEMKPESIMALFAACTAQQRASFSSQIIEGVDNGYTDPIMIISAVKNLSAILEDIEKFVKPHVINELEKNGGKLELYGISLLKKEAGTKYDFSQTKDPIHEYLALSFESIKKTIKDREDFLKSLPVDGQLVTDEDTGDTYKIYRPIKTSTTTFSASLSK